MAGTWAYTLDRAQPPAPAITGGSSGAGSDADVAWTFTGTGAASLECSLDGPELVADWAPCAEVDGFAATLALRPDGICTFAVRGVSTSGVRGPSDTQSYDFDRAGPAAPVVTAPASPAAGTLPRFTWTAEAGGSFACRVERAGTEIADWSACSSPDDVDLGPTGDGDLRRLRRPDRRRREPRRRSPRSSTRSTAPPPPPRRSRPRPRPGPTRRRRSRSPAPRRPSNAASPTPAAPTSSPGRAARARRGRRSSRSHPTATYTFGVRGIGGTGVPGAEDTVTYRLDTAAPAAPTISAGPASPTADDTPELTFTGEAGATFACQARHATHTSLWTSCTSPAGFDLRALDDGAWTLAVRATDAAGNTGAERTHGFTLDRAPPGRADDHRLAGRERDVARPVVVVHRDRRAVRLPDRRGGDVHRLHVAPPTYDLTGRPDGDVHLRGARRSSATDVPGDIQSSAYVLDTTGVRRRRRSPAARARRATTRRPRGRSPAPAGARRRRAASSAPTTSASPTGPRARARDSADLGRRGRRHLPLPRPRDRRGRQPGRHRLATATAWTARAAGAVRDAAPRARSAPSATAGVDRSPASRARRSSAASTGRPARVADWAACTSAARRPTSAAGPDGAYTFAVRAVDAAGNRGARRSVSLRARHHRRARCSIDGGAAAARPRPRRRAVGVRRRAGRHASSAA